MDLDGLTERIYEAAYSAQFEEEPHPVPSPSGCYNCLRRQWCEGKRLPRSDPLAVRTLKKMAAGKAIEDYWRGVYKRAGFDIIQHRNVDGSLTRIPILNAAGEEVMTGEVDSVLREFGQGSGEYCLLELKDLGVWSYFNILDDGVKNGERGYYYQVQCYLGGALQAGLIDVPICIFHAGQADATSVVWIGRVIKKRTERPPDFIIETIPFDQVAYNWACDRAEHVTWLLNNVDNVHDCPREFDPVALSQGRGSAFPCGKEDNPYCGHRQLCVETGGNTIAREEPYYGGN